MKKPIDYKYAKGFLERLNATVVNSPIYNKDFIFHGYDMWHSYQQSIFSDAKLFSIDKRFEDVLPPVSPTVKLRGAILTIISLVYSSLSVLVTAIFRPKIAIYSVDKISGQYRNDFRINEIYKTLQSQKCKYIECFHTIFTHQFLINLWKRKRFCLYIEGLDILAYVIKAPSIDKTMFAQHFTDENEIAFAGYILKKYLINVRISRIRVAALRSIIKFCGIKLFLSIDDTRYYHDLIITAHQTGIKFYAFQHGHFTKYQVGFLKMYKTNFSIIKPDVIFVWSEYWKRELLGLGSVFDQNDIQIAVPVSQIAIAKPNSDPQKGHKKSILLPYETDAPKAEVVRHIKAIKNLGYTIYFKLRQDMDVDFQIKDYGFDRDDIIPVTKLDDVQEGVALVVGVYSTFLYDMVAQQIPVAILETSMDYGYGMVKNNLADLIPVGINNAKFLEILNNSKETIVNRYDRLCSTNGKAISENITGIINSYHD